MAGHTIKAHWRTAADGKFKPVKASTPATRTAAAAKAKTKAMFPARKGPPKT